MGLKNGMGSVLLIGLSCIHYLCRNRCSGVQTNKFHFPVLR